MPYSTCITTLAKAVVARQATRCAHLTPSLQAARTYLQQSNQRVYTGTTAAQSCVAPTSIAIGTPVKGSAFTTPSSAPSQILAPKFESSPSTRITQTTPPKAPRPAYRAWQHQAHQAQLLRLHQKTSSSSLKKSSGR